MTVQELSALAEGLVPVVDARLQRERALWQKQLDSERADWQKELAQIRASNASIDTRLLELETRPTVAGPKGDRGEQGAQGERGERGSAGLDGKNVDPGLIVTLIKNELDAWPKPKDGKDGAPGEKGERGEQGPRGLDGKDGIDGKDGRDGLDGKDGAPGLNGKDGRDGLGIADAFIDREKSLVLTFTDGRTKSLGIVVGRDGDAGPAGRDVDMVAVTAFIKSELDTWPKPKDGINGKDGTVSVEELAFDYDGERTIQVKAAKTGYPLATWVMPNTIDRGVFEAGASYQTGDGVTHDGHYFIAKCDTVQEPGEGSTDWRLSVRRGKQGRDGKPGPPGQRGEKGDTGLQGPQGPMGRPVGV